MSQSCHKMSESRIIVVQSPPLYPISTTEFPRKIDDESILTQVIDFGEVVPGSITTKTIDIKNDQKKEASYNIHRQSFVNKAYQSFHFNKYNVTIGRNSSAHLKIKYEPVLERDENFDCFHILTDSREVERIYLKGRCLGTSVKCSTRRIYFIITPSVQRNVKTFELTNISKVPATFQLDDFCNELFDVDISNGQIQPKKSVYVTVTFKGKFTGLHYKKLIFLVYKHEPIVVELLGLYNKHKDYEDYLTSLTFYPIESCTSYVAYFNNYASLEEMLPFKLNRNEIDFGCVLPSYCDCGNTNIFPIILKNSMQNDIMVRWYKDPDNIFSVFPDESTIHADDPGYFEVSFKPTSNDRLYHKILTAQIFWRNFLRNNTPVRRSFQSNEDLIVPLVMNIHVIGHSFPNDRCWISAVEIVPSKILFPICLPGHQSFSTFMMKSDSHLPILYKIVGPRNSKFTIKPSMGMMKYMKLFVAKLTAGSVTELYEEVWKIEINGNRQKFSTLTLQGQCEIPRIVIGDDNCIGFDTVLPGCQDIKNVTVKNTSTYNLKIQFAEKNQYFHCKPDQLLLLTNEEAKIEWTFNGTLDITTETTMNCTMNAISNQNEFVGLPFDAYFKLNARCEYSQLCATPRYKELGDVAWGSMHKIEFKIYNFGESTVCYLLRALNVEDGNELRNVRFPERCGKLSPNGSKAVEISFEADVIRDAEFHIVYFTRLNEFSETCIETPNVELFLIKYKCIHPTLQIKECVQHNLGRIFSKLHVWKIFQVETWNRKLMLIKEGEKETVKINLPFFECHNKIHFIRFVLENQTKFELEANLSRIRKCKCRATEVSKSLTLRKKVFDCFHRHMLSMSLSNDDFVGNSYQFLDIFLNFNAKTDEEMAYDLKLTRDRHIEICFKMNNVAIGLRKLCPYDTFEHEFLAIFIGAKDPPYQAFWLYNNTQQAAPYEVDVENLDDLNGSERFPVITCYNKKGIIHPFSSCAILFKFHPIEARKYEVTLPLTSGADRDFLTLSGVGLEKSERIEPFTRINVPQRSSNIAQLPIIISEDHMTLPPFPVGNSKEKYICMQNVSVDKVMKYEWQECCIKGIIEITADNPVGLLQPMEKIGILLRVKSYGNPAFSTVNLTCRFLDATQDENHAKSVEMYQKKLDEFEQYFKIDEKGTHPMLFDYTIEPPSEEYFITVAVRFHIISVLDIPEYFSADDYFAQNPIGLAEKVILQKYDDGEDDIDEDLIQANVSEIIEKLTIDVLKCPFFGESLLCRQKITPYYIQMVEDRKKNEEIEAISNYFSQPPSRETSDIMKCIIKDVVGSKI